jgi:hypothetical protein
LVETEGLAGTEVAAQVLAGFVAGGLGDIAVAPGVVVGLAGVEDGAGAVAGVEEQDAPEVVAVARALIVVARAAAVAWDGSRAGLDGRVEPAVENWVRLDGLRVVRDD